MLTAIGSQIACAAQASLQADDLMNSARLVEYRNQASAKDRATSERIYRHAVEATKKDWAAAFKSFAESALAYPNSRALAKMSESRLKMLATKDKNVKLSALRDVAKHLDSALALNAVDHMLNAEESKLVEQDRTCIEEYLATKKRCSGCRPFDWIGL